MFGARGSRLGPVARSFGRPVVRSFGRSVFRWSGRSLVGSSGGSVRRGSVVLPGRPVVRLSGCPKGIVILVPRLRWV